MTRATADPSPAGRRFELSVVEPFRGGVLDALRQEQGHGLSRMRAPTGGIRSEASASSETTATTSASSPAS